MRLILGDLGYNDIDGYLVTYDEMNDDNFDEATSWDYFNDRSL